MKKNLNWRIIWKALHDMTYDLISVTEAISIIRAAGHPRPAEIVSRAVKHGYSMERFL